MADGKNENTVAGLVVAIKGEVSGLAARNHQFPKTVFDLTAEKWMAFQRFDSACDQIAGLGGRERIVVSQKINEPQQIRRGARRI